MKLLSSRALLIGSNLQQTVQEQRHTGPRSEAHISSPANQLLRQLSRSQLTAAASLLLIMIPLHHFTFWQDEGVYVPFRGGEKRTSVGTESVTTKKNPRRLKTNKQMKVEKDGVKRSGGKSEWKGFPE